LAGGFFGKESESVENMSNRGTKDTALCNLIGRAPAGYGSISLLFSLYYRVFFCPFSKNSRPPSKKLKPIFGKKTQHYGGNFEYQDKNSNIFDKDIQNLFKSSLDFQ